MAEDLSWEELARRAETKKAAMLRQTVSSSIPRYKQRIAEAIDAGNTRIWDNYPVMAHEQFLDLLNRELRSPFRAAHTDDFDEPNCFYITWA